MTGKHPTKADCDFYISRMQDYLDETLPRKESMSLFLHVRECEHCRAELESMKALFSALGDMPEMSPPDGFEDRILSAIPYDSYREMAEIRRERMPVILEEEILPAVLRSGATRVAGGVLAVLAGAGLAAGWLPGKASLLLLLGLMPEALIRLQQLSRRIYVGSVHKSAGR